jgi:hypothetical protein
MSAFFSNSAKAPSTDSSKVAIGESSAVKASCSLDELDGHPAAGQLAHQAAQVIKVAGQPVHRVHDHGVAVTDVRQHRLKLRPGRGLAGDDVGEHPVHLNAIELPPGFCPAELTRM